MAQVQGDWGQMTINHLISEQRDYNPEDEMAMATESIASLNAGQRVAHDTILESVLASRVPQCRPQGRLFLVHGSGGVGKTYLWNTLGHSGRGRSIIVLCVASSGIAALLIIGGRTTHMRFKLSIDIHATSVCNIRKNDPLAEMIRQTGLIIWDEVTMQNRFIVEAVDRSLRDFLDNDVPFGGITVAWGGDFKQTLPVIVGGSREETVGASIQNSYLWPHVKVLHLTENMWVDSNDPECSICSVATGCGGR